MTKKLLNSSIFNYTCVCIYGFTSIISFFWYIILGEDVDFNVLQDYLVLNGLYLFQTIFMILFLKYSENKLAKAIVFSLGLITLYILISGLLGVRVDNIQAQYLAYNRAAILIIHLFALVYSIIRFKILKNSLW